MFESHEHKGQCLKDMSQTKKINRFSEASQELLKDMNHRDLRTLWEFQEASVPRLWLLHRQPHHFWSCGRNLKHGRSVTQFQKDNHDLISIYGYVLKEKISSRRPKHGLSERQMRFHKAKEMLRNAKKHGYPTILSRWEGEETCRSSLMTEGFREEDMWNFDQLALETHDHIATRSERLRWWKSITSTSVPRTCRSTTRMSATTRRIYGEPQAVLQANPSKQATS